MSASKPAVGGTPASPHAGSGTASEGGLQPRPSGLWPIRSNGAPTLFHQLLARGAHPLLVGSHPDQVRSATVQWIRDAVAAGEQVLVRAMPDGGGDDRPRFSGDRGPEPGGPGPSRREPEGGALRAGAVPRRPAAAAATADGQPTCARSTSATPTDDADDATVLHHQRAIPRC